MPIFECEQCFCVDNTACCGYWNRGDGPGLCSECDPKIKKWHGLFDKESSEGYLLGNDGFLYREGEDFSFRKAHQGFKILGKITYSFCHICQKRTRDIPKMGASSPGICGVCRVIKHSPVVER